MFSSNSSQVSSAANYIEDMFSTYLYTGTSPTNQSINNGIDLSTKGGMVWFKGRNTAAGGSAQVVVDTVRGRASTIKTYTTNAAATSSAGVDLVSFNSNGFTVGEPEQVSLNNSGLPTNYVSWTFRKQPNFFDIVTWTGDGNAGRTIAHNLGSVPGCIMVKCTSAGTNWNVLHQSAGGTLKLNLTDAADSSFLKYYFGNNTSYVAPTSTVFTVGGDYAGSQVNGTGDTYVAYLFASNAGGFGLTDTDNVISCGSYTGNGSATGPIITLGYEPQWILLKQSSSAGNEWYLHDSMRGMPVGSADAFLNPNSAAAESSNENLTPLATGFQLATANGLANGSGETYIYIAIRRGPMKVPTDATKVFKTQAVTGTASTTTISGIGFAPDVLLSVRRTSATYQNLFSGKLTGTTLGTGSALATNSTAAESSCTNNVTAYNNDSITLGAYGTQGQNAGTTYVYDFLQRAPSFFDEVCYTGTGSAATVSHNLAAVPDLIIIKNRGAGGTNWAVNVRSISTNNWVLNLEEDTARFNNALFSSAPTSTTMTFTGAQVNAASNTYVAYLFATCAGVSKVGSYTGNGTSQAIACGFTGGARFVLIKRTDSTGDWYVYDTARGMTTLTDPYSLINSSGAEVATLGSVTTTTGGFTVNAAILAAINTSSATYIFLAIA